MQKMTFLNGIENYSLSWGFGLEHLFRSNHFVHPRAESFDLELPSQARIVRNIPTVIDSLVLEIVWRHIKIKRYR